MVQIDGKFSSCSICLELFDSDTRQMCCLVKCGHCLCRECATSCLKSNNKSCPACRHYFQTSDIINIFVKMNQLSYLFELKAEIT